MALFCALLVEAEVGAAAMPAAKLAQLRALAGDLGLSQHARQAARAYHDATPEEEPVDPEERRRREAVAEFFG